MENKRQGFTFIELLVVIAIIALLVNRNPSRLFSWEVVCVTDR